LAGFGEKLRRERELRGISLDQISTATKISTRMLKALEDEKFDLLPGGIFNKGFIRSYAKFLGIDEEQAVADYVAATGTDEPINNLPQIADIPERRSPEVDEGTISWTAIVVLVLIVAAGYGAWTYHNHRKAEKEGRATRAPVPAPSPVPIKAAAPTSSQPSPGTPKASTVKAPSSTPLETGGKGVPASTPSPAALKTESTEPAPKLAVDVVIHTSEESWVQAIADGRTVFSETLPAASEKHVTASRRITLTIGNAGGVEVTYNGATLPDIGGPGKVRTIVFSPNKFEFQSEDQ
jgi:cytoskeleton protein RodZ